MANSKEGTPGSRYDAELATPPPLPRVPGNSDAAKLGNEMLDAARKADNDARDASKLPRNPYDQVAQMIVQGANDRMYASRDASDEKAAGRARDLAEYKADRKPSAPAPFLGGK